ncbi:hypothetical protein [Bradyrhizobium sp. McL0615]|uniref:hypothetical protein n=1 Tax=Bradyrhizobium sp. McL0615 TaxID=3415673 RepID=UPI003CF75C6E
MELQSGIRHIDAGFLKRFLKAAKVLRDAVDERAFHIEDVTREHGLAKSEEYPVTAREIATGSLRAAARGQGRAKGTSCGAVFSSMELHARMSGC